MALEVLRVPWSALGGSASSLPQAFFLGFKSAIDFLWAPVLFQLYVAALLATRRRALKEGALSWVLIVTLAAGICAFSYAGLVRYAPFRAYPPFIALFVLLFVFLLLWIRALLKDPTEPESRWGTLLRWSLPVGGFLGFAVSTVLNRRLYPDAYPTLHLSILQVSYLLLHASVTALLARASWPVRVPRAARWTLGAVVFHLIFLSVPIVDGGLCDGMRPAFLRFTDLGRSYALKSTASGKERAPARAEVRHAAAPALDDPGALARFRKHSGLPRLPARFDLSKYNLLLISADALRFRETDLNRGVSGLTPRLAAFAKKGRFWFERAYSGAPGTLQSFGALWTMSYPAMSRIDLETSWHGGLSEAETTVPELFRAAGYHTFYAGHNFPAHFGEGPKLRGLLQGIADRRLAPGKSADKRNPNQDAIILGKAIAAIDAARRRPERFFGWIFFESPHAPYLAHYPEMPAATDLERYRQEVRFVDTQIGKVFDHLEKTDLMEKTIVIVLSDHGEGFGLHKKKRHADVYSEITRVPLILSIPGVPGRGISEPTSTLYVFPWLLLRGPKALRARAETQLRTRIGPMLRDTEGAIVSEMLCIPNCARTALVYRDYRLIYDFASKYHELYDLRADPDEQRNVFNGGSDLGKRFVARLQGYLRLRQALGATRAIPEKPHGKH